MLVLTFKALNSVGSGYLKDCLLPHYPSHQLRSTSQTLLSVLLPSEGRQEVSRYSMFSVVAPCLQGYWFLWQAVNGAPQGPLWGAIGEGWSSFYHHHPSNSSPPASLATCSPASLPHRSLTTRKQLLTPHSNPPHPPALLAYQQRDLGRVGL